MSSIIRVALLICPMSGLYVLSLYVFGSITVLVSKRGKKMSFMSDMFSLLYGEPMISPAIIPIISDVASVFSFLP